MQEILKRLSANYGEKSSCSEWTRELGKDGFGNFGPYEELLDELGKAAGQV